MATSISWYFVLITFKRSFGIQHLSASLSALNINSSSFLLYPGTRVTDFTATGLLVTDFTLHCNVACLFYAECEWCVALMIKPALITIFTFPQPHPLWIKAQLSVFQYCVLIPKRSNYRRTFLLMNGVLLVITKWSNRLVCWQFAVVSSS